jgi:hypothetical protein
MKKIKALGKRRKGMKEYKRLTGKGAKGVVITSGCKTCGGCTLDCAHVEGALKRLAELEDKIEQGILIELPCKVGDTVYVIRKKALKGHWEEHRYIVDEWGKLAVYEKEFNLVLFSVSKIGEDYFLTKAEAEAKLKELREKGNDR